MKRFIMTMALSLAVVASPLANQSGWAMDAHHPGKSKKVAMTRASTNTSNAAGMMLNCPMMRRSPMRADAAMMQAGTMRCPMAAAHGAGMMPSPQRSMMPGEQRMMMQRMHGQCWIETDRDHGYGYWGQCPH